MRRRSFLLGSVVTITGGSSLLASGAFSQTESQRTVTVETVGDEDAYLRLEYEDAENLECSETETVRLVELTNQLKTEITDVTVSYDLSGDEPPETGELVVPETLSIGESGDVTIDIECRPPNQEETTITFTVEVTGDELDLVVQDREITVTCDCPGQAGAENVTESTNETVETANESGEPVNESDVSINESAGSTNESVSDSSAQSSNTSTE